MNPPPLPAGAAARLDPQHPWPGLGSYDEYGSEFFSGRTAEALDLAQMIRLWGAVVLSGESGLGKTSLLRAGVFPKLRELGFFPIYIRLLHAPDAPPYGRQVIDRVIEECRSRPDMEPPVLPEAGESAWTWLHREDVEFWNSRNQLMTPVLVFDQFEEIFTRGAENRRRSESEAFFAELADIAENRRPDELPAGCGTAQNYRVVLSLRKEYLSELEVCLGPRMPSALQNRFHLAPLSLESALEVVRRPAEPGQLLEPGAEMAIVTAVSGLRINREIGGTLSSPDIGGNTRIEPALLCLLCSELNSERLRLQQDRISTSLVEARGGDIIEGFYERALADFPAEVQRMVETLVTPNGQRLSRAEEEVLAMPGITPEILRELTENDRKRLLRRDRGLGGIPTLELVHDCLAPIVARHREERHRQDLGRERRIRQLKVLATIMGVLAVGALGTGLSIAWTQANAARKARDLSQQRLRQSAVTDDLIAAEKATRRDADSSAYLARALENDPAYDRARERAMETLLQGRTAPEPLGSSPGLRAGPFEGRDGLVLVDGAGNLVTWEDPEGNAGPRKLDPNADSITVSAGAAQIAWTSRIEIPVADQDGKSGTNRDAKDPGSGDGKGKETSRKEESPATEREAGALADDGTGSDGDETSASETSPCRLHLFDRAKGLMIQGPVLQTKPASISLAADGRSLLILSPSGSLRIWDGKADGTIRTVFEDEGIKPAHLHASVNGGWHAVGMKGSSPVILTIPASGETTHTTLGHQQAIAEFIETAGGSRIVTRDIDGKVIVFNTLGYRVLTLATDSPVRLIATDPLGLTITTVDDAGVADFWNVIDGERCRPSQSVSQSSRPVRILDEGRHLVVTESDGSVFRYRSAWHPGSADSAEIASFGVEANQAFLLADSPLGPVLVVSTDDYRLHFLDPATGAPRREPVSLPAEPNPVIALRGGRQVIAGCGGSAWIVPLASGESPEEFKIQAEDEVEHGVVDLAVSPDHQTFHVLTSTGILESRRLDAGDATPASMQFPEERGTRLVISPQSANPWIAMTTRMPSQRDWKMRVFPLTGDHPGAMRFEWDSGSEIWTTVTDPTGRWLAAITMDARIHIFDLDSEDPQTKGRRTISLPSQAYHAIFLVGGERPVLVTGDSQGQLSRWDVIDGEARRDEFANPCPETVTSLSLSPSGKWLACTTVTGRAMVWNTASGFAGSLPIAHATRVWTLAFDESSEPGRVFSCSRDGRIRVSTLGDGLGHDARDAASFTPLLQWQSGRVIGDDGRASRLSTQDRQARLEDAISKGRPEIVQWTSAPSWERGKRPGQDWVDPAELLAESGIDRRFPHLWRRHYDRDPEDALATIALAAWVVNDAHAAWLADQATPRLSSDAATQALAVNFLCDAGLHDKAVELVKKWPTEDPGLPTALAAARASSLAGDPAAAKRWLSTHAEDPPDDRAELANLVLECFRAGANVEGLRLHAKLGEMSQAGPETSTEAWAALAAAIVGHPIEPAASLALAETAAEWFEKNYLTYGWKGECASAWAIATQFLRNHDKETELGALAIYRYAIDEQSDMPFATRNFEGIEALASLWKTLGDAASTPELESTDLYLGRILHLWFSGDVEGARRTWAMLLEFDGDFDDPGFRAGLQLWPYELRAIEKLAEGEDNWMEEVEIPTDAAEWSAFGMADPDIMVELADDTSEDILAGRILHLSLTGDSLNAVATARILLRKNPEWAEARFLEEQGWDAEEIATFLSATDEAQSSPSE